MRSYGIRKLSSTFCGLTSRWTTESLYLLFVAPYEELYLKPDAVTSDAFVVPGPRVVEAAEGPISYWNAYVAVTQMGGQGNFSDPRLGIDVKHSPDMVGSKLPALRAYQHSIEAPAAPALSTSKTSRCG